MPKRQLSEWGKFCCVTYTETKELVNGSPLYSAMYQVIYNKKLIYIYIYVNSCIMYILLFFYIYNYINVNIFIF